MSQTIYDVQMQKIRKVLDNQPTGENGRYILDICKEDLCPIVVNELHYLGYILIPDPTNPNATLIIKW